MSQKLQFHSKLKKFPMEAPPSYLRLLSLPPYKNQTSLATMTILAVLTLLSSTHSAMAERNNSVSVLLLLWVQMWPLPRQAAQICDARLRPAVVSPLTLDELPPSQSHLRDKICAQGRGLAVRVRRLWSLRTLMPHQLSEIQTPSLTVGVGGGTWGVLMLSQEISSPTLKEWVAWSGGLLLLSFIKSGGWISMLLLRLFTSNPQESIQMRLRISVAQEFVLRLLLQATTLVSNIYHRQRRQPPRRQGRHDSPVMELPGHGRQPRQSENDAS